MVHLEWEWGVMPGFEEPRLESGKSWPGRRNCLGSGERALAGLASGVIWGLSGGHCAWRKGCFCGQGTASGDWEVALGVGG